MVRFVFLFLFALGCTTAIKRRTPANYSAIPVPSPAVDAVIERLGPVGDQEDSGMCFAHATADLATWNIGKRVSPFSVAIQYFRKREGPEAWFFSPAAGIAQQSGFDSRFMIGLASGALETSLKSNLCGEERAIYKNEELSRLWNVYQHEYRTYFGPQSPVHIYDKLRLSVKVIAPALPADDLIGHLRRHDHLDEALGRWFDRNCSLRFDGGEKWEIAGKTVNRTSAQVLADINSALASGQPAIVHYSADVLTSGAPQLAEFYIGFHVSVIVTVANFEGQKYYLLRNSWGEDCSIYSEQIAARCDRGHIWLTEQEIQSHFTSAHYLRRR